MRESVDLIRAAGATPGGVVIALDRMERGIGELSAVQEVKKMHGLSVTSIINLDDLVEYLQNQPELKHHLRAVERYLAQYGIK